MEASLTRLLAQNWPPVSVQTHFASPIGEPALVPHDSVSWRVFKNPIALFVGGIAAVILELAEPCIRTAIWKNSAFLGDPLGRLQRTGMAAMVTIFAAQTVARPMIERVVRLHSRISGVTPAGMAFSADDSALLTWVHVTATASFARAYSTYVSELPAADLDRICAESSPIARLYGAMDVPTCFRGLSSLIAQAADSLEPSDALQEFLCIMRTAPLLPMGLRWLQPIAVRAAVRIIPPALGIRLGLDEGGGLSRRDELCLKLAGSVADSLVLPASPASQACIRLGLSASYLYR
jgi:uncharacterized protein (DUF2236 family)